MEDTPSKEMSFLSIATQRSVFLRSVRIALIVGSVLAVLNHGDSVLAGTANMVTVFKIALTFLVPYCVSTYSSVLAVRERMQTL